MVYFRNKFNEEFLFLANEQTPKGGQVRLDDPNPLFFKIIKNGNKNQSRWVRVIPLLLFNRIVTSNNEDRVIEDKMVLCKNESDTTVTCCYDKDYIQINDNYLCQIMRNMGD